MERIFESGEKTVHLYGDYISINHYFGSRFNYKHEGHVQKILHNAHDIRRTHTTFAEHTRNQSARGPFVTDLQGFLDSRSTSDNFREAGECASELCTAF